MEGGTFLNDAPILPDPERSAVDHEIAAARVRRAAFLSDLYPLQMSRQEAPNAAVGTMAM